MNAAKKRVPTGISPPSEEALPCVWMTARLIGYRLCDRQQDCDGCPLDRALRRADLREAEPPTVRRAPPAPWTFPPDRRYHPGHAWALDLGHGRLRCGVDVFAARLLGHATSIVIAAEHSTLRLAGISCWFGEDDDLIPLRAPVTGTVRRRNEKIQDEPELLASSPYDDGWLFEVDATANWSSGLLSAQQMRCRAERQMQTLQRQVDRFVGQARDDVGTTLADGGYRLADLRKILGPSRYTRLVARFLN